MTLNCQGLRDRNKCSVLFFWLNCCKADVVCLQETRSISTNEFSSWVQTESDCYNNLQQFSAFSSPGSDRSRGVAILFTPTFSVERSISDSNGRLQLLNLRLKASEASVFQVACIYGPNQKAPGKQFFESLFPRFDAALPLLVCGDFNTVLDPMIDRRD